MNTRTVYKQPMRSSFSARWPVRPTSTMGLLPTALGQLIAVAACAGVAVLLAEVHLAQVARPLFLVMAVGVAIHYKRRSPWEYLTVSLWFWSVSPFVRRVIDYFGGFSVANVVLITPNVLVLMMTKDILTSREIMRRPESAIGLLGIVPVVVGLCNSFFRGDVAPGFIGAADWVTPLFYFFYIINYSKEIRSLEQQFRSFLALNMLVIGVYGLYQYASPPPWDVEWILNTKFDSAGTPVPFGLRAFSMLNAPGICAAWLTFLVLLSLYFTTSMSLLMLPLVTLLLAVTLVRSSIGATVVGLIVLLIFGSKKMVRTLSLVLGATLAVGVIVSLLDPKISESLINRFETINDLSHDGSAIARADLYRRSPDMIAAAPFGLGVGALGRAARGSESSIAIANLDSGPVSIFLALGWLGGTVYLMGFVAAAAQAVMVAQRTKSGAALSLAAAAVGGASVLLFVNLVGILGMLIWIPAGYAAAIGIDDRTRRLAGQALPAAAPTRHPLRPAQPTK